MDNERLGELVGSSVASGQPLTAEALAPVFSDQEITAMAKERGLALGQASTNGATETPTEAETGKTSEPSWEEKQAEIISNLTPEQRERALDLQSAMAEQFSTDESKLSSEDFGLVLVGEGEDRQVIVMLTIGNGLYKGSYNTVMADSKKNNQAYTVELDGQKVDTRQAMTWDVYQAFIKQAKEAGIDPLPDSKQLEAANDQPWTGTWLTGEKPDGFSATFGAVNVGLPRRDWGNRDRDWDDMRVRPAAAV